MNRRTLFRAFLGGLAGLLGVKVASAEPPACPWHYVGSVPAANWDQCRKHMEKLNAACPTTTLAVYSGPGSLGATPGGGREMGRAVSSATGVRWFWEGEEVSVSEWREHYLAMPHWPRLLGCDPELRVDEIIQSAYTEAERIWGLSVQ